MILFNKTQIHEMRKIKQFFFQQKGQFKKKHLLLLGTITYQFYIGKVENGK